MDTHLAGFGAECVAFYADVVTQVEQFFNDGIEHRRVFVAAIDLFLAQVQLDTARCVLQVHKHRLSCFTGSHDAAGNSDLLVVEAVFGTVFEYFFLVVGNDIGSECRYVEHVGRIWIDAEFAEFLQRITAEQFLFSHMLVISCRLFVIGSRFLSI